MERLVTRTDCYGIYHTEKQIGYVLRTQGTKLGEQSTSKHKLTAKRLLRHYRATERKDVIGVHPANANNLAKWCGVDIDRHTDEDDPDTNWRATLHWYDKLCSLGLHPLLTDSNGSGGYHLRVLLREPIPADHLFHFLKKLTADHQQFGFDTPPEVFPKQADVRNCKGGYGNWLRLPGRHHKREHWTRAWDGEQWLEGHKAIDYILSLNGDESSLILSTPMAGDTPIPPVAVPPTRGKMPGGKEGQRLERAERANRARSGFITGSGPGEAPKTGAFRCMPDQELGYETASSITGTLHHKVDGSPVVPREIRLLVKKHQPERRGQRNRKLFLLAQAVKGLLGSSAPHPLLKAVFDLWWKSARKVVGNQDYDFNLLEFFRAYDNCRYPGGLDWKTVLRESEKEEVPVQVAWYTPRMKVIVRICSYLQRQAGRNPFYLSETLAAQLAGMSQPAAHKALGLMQSKQSGLLRRETVGNRETGKVSTYYYLPLVERDVTANEG